MLLTLYSFLFLTELASCDERSCHPETGNLLIGREHKLTTTSTCGLRDPERYCVISGLTQKKKCFVCDGKSKFVDDKFKYHGIENIVPTYGMKRKDKWWQAENGLEKVTVQLDLESEFHFTHLMIIFQTFRPAAMVIERSKDFGKTWEIYQYFAQDCQASFPYVSTGQRRSLSDVVCTSQYSAVEPSSFGEVIFRVLPPDIPVENPYAPDVQNLLKLTNLRLNFTKLHTLGDNLLDERPEIKEKYYYAISKMIVRGKCSCYGHASRCIPEPGQPNVPLMVYGKCECTHHTKGRNCEVCEDLYNDLEWKPAVGEEQNACKRCNCNNHAQTCQFDHAVFEASGRVSGGVCHACEHNTQGKNCEQCKPFFYRDVTKPLDDPNVCLPCDCDPRGSFDDGICDSADDNQTSTVSGNCHCKMNVKGRRCDECKAGYWNFREENPFGCEPCSCNQLGTVGNQGCDVVSGECVCKRNVVGRDCNQCAPEFYGLGADPAGCKPCDCDDGGAYDNNCDFMTGQCRCRPHVTGRKCDTPEAVHFAPLIDHLRYEGEQARSPVDTKIVEREQYPNAPRTWTGGGFLRVSDKSYVEFDIRNIPTTMEYDVYARYEPQAKTAMEAKVILERISGPPDFGGPCKDATNQDRQSLTFSQNERLAKLEFGSFCLEKGRPYTIRIDMVPGMDGIREAPPTLLLDSIILVPRTDKIPFFESTPRNHYKKQEFIQYHCDSDSLPVVKKPFPEVCKKYLSSTGLLEFDGAQECACDLTGSESGICDVLGGQCTCKPNVINRQCDRCAPGFYGFGPEGCKPCDCHNIGSLDPFCDQNSGQCHCRNNTYGRRCDECQPGFWNYPNCQRCSCNGHTDECDSKTGVCIGCRDHSTGPSCEVCERGFYGNPHIDENIPCRPCPCPGTPGSGLSHADTCELHPQTQNPVCRCLPGYVGERCDRCDHNFWGSPNNYGGSCESCQCNNNIDMSQPGNCDPGTGDCLRCLYDTDGKHCEVCRRGFFGDATKQSCAQCVCNELGTNSSDTAMCNPTSGQCPCLPNVVGKECSECAPNHWNLASGKGCDACECDLSGSYSLKCNLFDGQCHCKPGHGGRRCNECQANHWGDPRIECFPCACSTSGSSSAQCDRTNGSCICLPGMSGDKCDKCARGFLGNAPHCTSCGECFENWDVVIRELKKRTERLIDNAKRIKQTGATGAYKEEFSAIERGLAEVERVIAGANVTNADVAGIERIINALRLELNKIQEQLQALANRIKETTTRTTNANLQVNHLKNNAKALEMQTQNIKENMTALQEANVEGAYNLTRDAEKRSKTAALKVSSTVNIVGSSANKRSETENMLNNFSSKYNQTFTTNEEGLAGLGRRIRNLEDKVPDVNQLVCDGRAGVSVDTCDNLCGGAGCGKCGGISCKGATTLAANALDVATQSKNKLTELQDNARKQLEGILAAKSKSDEALKQALLAYEKSILARNTSHDTTMALQQLLDEIDKFFADEATKPAEIRTIAETCLALEMSLTPDQILDLARQINTTMSGITNIEAILVATASDLQTANDLKRRGDYAKVKADEILGTATQVLDALERARAAQDKAQEAIRKATRDIEGANGDLLQISRESDAAQNLTQKAADEISALQDRLDDLKKKFTQTELDVKKAALEADVAMKLSKEAAGRVGDLEGKYAQAKNALDMKAKDSGSNKLRAERLRDRAKALAEAANSKFRDLQGKS